MKHLIDNQHTYVNALTVMLVAAIAILFPEFAVADNTVFNKVEDKMESGFDQTRRIIYIIGGLGAIGLGIGAFFGKFKWGWFFSLLGGLAVIALIIEGINFIVTDTSGGDGDGIAENVGTNN